MSSTSSTPFLTVPNANETETRQLRRTFWVRLNRYARNEDILALASTNRAHAEALRPHCFKKVRVSTATHSAQDTYRALVNHRASIENLTLVLESRGIQDLQCLTFQDMVIHNPFDLLHTICRGGLRKVVMKGVFAYHSVVSAASTHSGFSYLTTEIPSLLTSLVFNEVGLGGGLLKSIVDLLGSGLRKLQFINCICGEKEIQYALGRCPRLTHFDLCHRDEVFTRALFPSEFASQNIIFMRLAINFVAFAWFQLALCKLHRLRQLSIYKRSRPQLPGIRRALPRLVIHYITTEEFNNLVNREYVERVADG
ncbi:hypothetical protein BJ085DRAFT_40429 [Dimargaris cristalligena]|uniref:F-box domain-containing protein n=1 Tax=Dimargaris cristalligena TaxID=215637 RepID=A0A4P9ZXY5_9FUNG|nr:hypothetical protein BJ085DRAFT_40429 [Dimargaris cristalligena]|eukprot:RKP38527.1 hypothetical protein BJ085DRAFT_40429 [Dimargaris cristalligena]